MAESGARITLVGHASRASSGAAAAAACNAPPQPNASASNWEQRFCTVHRTASGSARDPGQQAAARSEWRVSGRQCSKEEEG